MRILFIALSFVLAAQAHAGLFSDIEAQERQRGEEIGRQNDANRRAWVAEQIAAYLVKSLGMPEGTSVTDEGEDRGGFYSVEQYNVGGIWGCGVGSMGVGCVNRSGQHVHFSGGPIRGLDDRWYCINFPEVNPQCHHRSKSRRHK